MNDRTPFFDHLPEYRQEPPPPSDWKPRTAQNEEIAAASLEHSLAGRAEMRRAYSRVGIGLFTFILLPQILAAFVYAVTALVYPALLDATWFLLIVSDVCMYFVGIPVAMLIIGTPHRASSVQPQRLLLRHFFAALFVFQAVAIVGDLISQALMGILSLLSGYSYGNAFSDVLIDLPLPLMFLLVVVVGPIAEEFIFRRVPMDALLPYGEWPAVLVTSLAFSLAHGNFYQLFYTFGGGLVLGILYARTRRLRYPIALHMLFNFIGSFLPMVIMTFFFTEESVTMALWGLLLKLLYVLLTWGMAITGIVLFCMHVKDITLRPAEVALPDSKNGRARYLNVGMLLLLICSSILLLLSLVPGL